MKKNEKRRQIAVELVWFLLVGGGEIAFSGCDQIQEFLGMGGDDESAPQPEPEPGPPQEPDTYLADGGAVSFVQDGGQWYEAHIFTEEVPGSLSFIDTGTASIEAVDYLIVGGDDDRPARDNPGGGGADGLLYKTNQTLALTEGSVGVTVGQGGAGGTPQSQGGDGGSSAIGTIVVPGGGGGGGATSNMNGRPGGSGGGAGAGNESTSGFAGTGKQNTNGNEGDLDPGLCGNDGNIGDIDIDAGGGVRTVTLGELADSRGVRLMRPHGLSRYQARVSFHAADPPAEPPYPMSTKVLATAAQLFRQDRAGPGTTALSSSVSPGSSVTGE
jgi:hypothetical protein